MAREIRGADTDSIVRAALTGLTTRQRVIGNNLANIDTPGFKASRVDFEAKLAEAIRKRESAAKAQATAPGLTEASQPDLSPSIVRVTETSGREDGNNVDIDGEMVKLVETNVAYDSLVRLMSARLSLLKTIASGGYR
ncbi:MAG: flagellar basal body rod protein FlgB [Chloroflexi bacterium]|nr:flagellar basal body rod protein FlgB [Chloroflexota bacterium]